MTVGHRSTGNRREVGHLQIGRGHHGGVKPQQTAGLAPEHHHSCAGRVSTHEIRRAGSEGNNANRGPGQNHQGKHEDPNPPGEPTAPGTTHPAAVVVVTRTSSCSPSRSLRFIRLCLMRLRPVRLRLGRPVRASVRASARASAGHVVNGAITARPVNRHGDVIGDTTSRCQYP